MAYYSIEDVRKANEKLGHHWFKPDTVRFFKSRIHSDVYGGRFFVSSEVPWGQSREYSVRAALPDGSIETVNGLDPYASRSGAHAAARRLGSLAPEVRKGSEFGGENSFSVYCGETFIFCTYDEERAEGFCR